MFFSHIETVAYDWVLCNSNFFLKLSVSLPNRKTKINPFPAARRL